MTNIASNKTEPVRAESLLLPGIEQGSTEKPFLRWAGGKTRLLKTILPHTPSSINRYFEPFLGSGAMYYALRDRASKCFLSDLNSELINFWQHAKSSPLELFEAVQPYVDRQDEDEYYKVRAEDPQESLLKAARFLYLNQTAWNGLWRENRWGQFNVPFGARPFRGIEKDRLLAISQGLAKTDIKHRDFRESAKLARKGDFIYFDPPYLPISDTSKFSGYNGKRFRIADLEELAKITRRLSDRGVSWMISNRDNEVVRDLFSHGEIIRFTTRRSIAAQSKKSIQPKDSPEVIISGGK